MKINTARQKLEALSQAMYPESGTGDHEIVDLRDEFCLYLAANVKPTASNWGKIIKNLEISEENLEFITLYQGLSEEWLRVLRKYVEKSHAKNKKSNVDETNMNRKDEDKEIDA